MEIETILIVAGRTEQDELNEILGGEGYEIETLEDASDTLQAVNQLVPDLLFLDLKLRDEAEQLMDEIFSSHPRSPEVILITDGDSKQKALTGMERGALDYVETPLVAREVEVMVEKAERQWELRNENRRLETELERLEGAKEDDEENPLGPSYLFHVLMDHIPDAVYFKNRDSEFLYASRALAEKHGLGDPEDIRGKTDFDFFSREHAQQAYEDEKKIIEGGEPIVGKEEKETWHSGRETWASTTKAPLVGPDGNIIGTFGITRDITRRKKAEQELQSHVEEMEKELERAQVVQEALLPSDTPAHPRLNLAFRFLPYELVSGDHFSLIPLEEDRLGIFVGDVSGHGVSAALFMALIKFLTDRHAKEVGTEPATFIRLLNEQLMELDAHPSKFVTGIYGCFDPREQEGCNLTISKAGHPDPVLVSEGGENVRFLEMSSQGALGIMPEFDPMERELEMKPGDRLYLYTDGLSEARNAEQEFLSSNTFLELIQQSQQPSLGESLDRIIETVKDVNRTETFEDDVVLCGVEVKESE